MTFIRFLGMLVSAIALSGCAELALRQKERQMELVARDWAMTIRASQVVPVYPLTQDLLPGDVFLVQMPIGEQSSRYRDRGFLPTDLQIARLGSDGYRAFYESIENFKDGDAKLTLPKDWRAGPPADSIAGSILNSKENKDTYGSIWRSFPRAGFPSYTFQVSNRGGLSAALPVQGIPVALSMTGAARATGSITIADAVSYGLDAHQLYDRLRLHVKEHSDEITPPSGDIWYLRVVTRVFAAKRFDIVLTATSTFGGGLDVGAPKPVADTEPPKPLPVPANLKDATPEVQKVVEKDLENQAAARKAESDRAQATKDGQALEGGLTISTINERLKSLEAPAPKPGEQGAAPAATGLTPGVSLRATFASGRTVGFQETYTEPIVVGYHGFDVAINSDGIIGAIVPTFAVIDGSAVPSSTAFTSDDSIYNGLLDSVEALQSTNPGIVAKVLDKAASHNPSLESVYVTAKAKNNNRIAAWKAATRSYIDAAPISTKGDTATERRRQVRRWLAGEVREAKSDLAPKKPAAPSEPAPTGPTGPAGPTSPAAPTGAPGPTAPTGAPPTPSK